MLKLAKDFIARVQDNTSSLLKQGKLKAGRRAHEERRDLGQCPALSAWRSRGSADLPYTHNHSRITRTHESVPATINPCPRGMISLNAWLTAWLMKNTALYRFYANCWIIIVLNDLKTLEDNRVNLMKAATNFLRKAYFTSKNRQKKLSNFHFDENIWSKTF